MFKVFGEAVQLRFMEMSEGELFVVRADDAFERYLAAFPPGSNLMYRKRTEHDCQCCKQFVRRLGVVVSIANNRLVTVWGGHNIPQPYKTVADAMDTYIRSLPIEAVFRTVESRYGIGHNYDSVTNLRHDHFVGEIAARHRSKDADTRRSEKAAIHQVLSRGLEQINVSDIDQVLDLIASNGLYRGEEHKPALEGFRKLLIDYKSVENPTLFVWANLDDRNARFRNTVIGTLLTDLAEGKDIDVAVKSFETKVAPMNYKRPTAVITQKMVEDAVQKLTTLGLHGAISRRFARLSDVSVNDVLFVDNESRSQMKDGVAALLESSIQKTAPDLKHATIIDVEHFVTDVLPSSRTIEIKVENRHVGNFVSLTGADGPERLFKWNNNFAWSYDGDVTDSVKQRVKAAGGNVNADLRVSLSWFNFDDLDLHAECPVGHVYYGDKKGILDVDMNAGMGRTKTPVENLAFNRPADGTYRVSVHQFNRRETTDVGFELEVETGGVLRQFSYAKPVSGYVPCLTMRVVKGRLVDLQTTLTEGTASQDKWGIKTETLVPVTAIMFSPNHWSGNSVGARHMIFALRGCKNPQPTRGIYNEYLRPDLDQHRKVFEVLGAKTKCQPSDDQISGLGFTAARGDTVNVVVDGRRSYLLKF